jgi:hypothetical protein
MLKGLSFSKPDRMQILDADHQKGPADPLYVGMSFDRERERYTVIGFRLGRVQSRMWYPTPTPYETRPGVYFETAIFNAGLRFEETVSQVQLATAAHLVDGDAADSVTIVYANADCVAAHPLINYLGARAVMMTVFVAQSRVLSGRSRIAVPECILAALEAPPCGGIPEAAVLGLGAALSQVQMEDRMPGGPPMYGAELPGGDTGAAYIGIDMAAGSSTAVIAVVEAIPGGGFRLNDLVQKPLTADDDICKLVRRWGRAPRVTIVGCQHVAEVITRECQRQWPRHCVTYWNAWTGGAREVIRQRKEVPRYPQCEGWGSGAVDIAVLGMPTHVFARAADSSAPGAKADLLTVDDVETEVVELTPRERLEVATREACHAEDEADYHLLRALELCGCDETRAEVGAVLTSVRADLDALQRYLALRAEIDVDTVCTGEDPPPIKRLK